MSLGVQIKQKFLDLFEFDLDFKGCTEDEIEQVKKIQNILYIPYSYQSLLKVMGHRGLSWIAMGEADWNLLEAAKRDFINIMQYHKIPYPNDLLVFYSEQDRYYYCRTKAHIDDPPVYGYSAAWRVEESPHLGIVKLAESLSKFWFMLLLDRKELVDTGRISWEPLARVHYDIELDEYLETD